MNDVINMGKDLPTLKEFGEPYIFGHIGALTFHPCFINSHGMAGGEKG